MKTSAGGVRQFGTATFASEDHDGAIVFRLSGEIDETNVKAIFDEVERVLGKEKPTVYHIGNFPAENVRFVIFDVEHLRYANSKFIGFLSSLFGEIEDAGGTMHICNAQDAILDTLKLCGLTALLPVIGTVESSLAEFAKKNAG